MICTCTWLAGVFEVLSCPTSYGIVPVMALMLNTFNVTSHVNSYLHVHHSRCLLCMSIDVILAGWQETFRSFCPTSYGIVPVMALMLNTFNVTSHVNSYLHVHHSRCLLCMSIDVILAGWQETFRSTASRLAADLKVSCQPAGRRHFLFFSFSKKVNAFQNMRKSHIITKPTKWSVRPAKTQIRLGIRPVWSESSLSAWRKLGTLATQRADSGDSDQTGRILRDAQSDPSLHWAHRSFCWFCRAAAHIITTLNMLKVQNSV